MDTWTVYILRCSDATTYTGCTSSFGDRLLRHEQGTVHFTKSRLPVSVILTIEFRDKYKTYTLKNI